jgi:hypothetical protein
MSSSDASEVRLRRFRDLRWTSYSLVWSLSLLLVYGLYCAARASIVREVRNQAKAVATAVSHAVDPALLQGIRTAEDMGSPAYLQIQAYLTRVVRANPDIRYAYTMRRASRPGAGPGDYEFIVDQAAYDANGSGRIEREEESEPVGTPYSAIDLPAMVRAWEEPSADRHPSPDPPYPDVLSGYAPVRAADGGTVAIVGVDVTSETLLRKLTIVRIAAAVAWVLLSALLMAATHFLLTFRELMEIRGRLIAGLEEANHRLKDLRELLPVCASCRKVRNDQEYWDRVEAYIAEHPASAQGKVLCPECAAKIAARPEGDATPG